MPKIERTKKTRKCSGSGEATRRDAPGSYFRRVGGGGERYPTQPTTALTTPCSPQGSKGAGRPSTPLPRKPGAAFWGPELPLALAVRLNYMTLKTKSPLFLGYSTVCLARQEMTGDRNLGLLAAPDGTALITWKTPDTGTPNDE